MPPKRKVAKKIVKKTARKGPSAPDTPVPATPAAADPGSPVPDDSPAVETEEAVAVVDETPVAEEKEEEEEQPVAVEAAPSDALKEDAVPGTAPPVEEEPQPEEAEQPGVAAAAGDVVKEKEESGDAPEPEASAVPEAEKGSGKKIVKRVKKVKKIIVKKVPKVVKKEDAKAAAEAAVVVEEGRAGDCEGGNPSHSCDHDDAACAPAEVEKPSFDASDSQPMESDTPAAASVGCEPTETESTVLVAAATDVKTNISQPKETEDMAAMASCGETSASQPMEMESTDAGTAVASEEAPKEKGNAEDMNKEEALALASVGVGDEEAAISERQRRRKTEIFIGGLGRSVMEEDIRKVFEKAGEIVEVRMMMDTQTGKNKGYAFLRYSTAAQAKQAVSEFAKVEVCGKLCGAAALEGNDTIFLGNIDKKWKKEDVLKILQEIGIEKIDALTVMCDPNDTDSNRGFAFLELESNKDAQIAYKKLQKKDAFGNNRNVKVAWATPLNEPDEEEMLKVKSVYAEGLPATWTEEKIKECFSKFGDIEKVVLARNLQSAKRKDFAFINYTTRESAISCIGSFDKEIIEHGSKVNIKVSLAKPIQKGRQTKGSSKFVIKDVSKEKPKAYHGTAKFNASSSRGQSAIRGHGNTAGDRKSSTTAELMHVLREQATWRQAQPGYAGVGYAGGPPFRDYPYAARAEKRPFSSLGEPPLHSDPRGYPRARLDSSYPASNPSPLPSGVNGGSHPYYQQPNVGYGTGGQYGSVTDPSSTFQSSYGPAYRNTPYGSNTRGRY